MPSIFVMQPKESLPYFFICIWTIHALWELYQAISILKSRSSGDNTAYPSVTVVVAAHNEAENLRKLLPELLTQEYKNYTVTVVLDRCTDESRKLLEKIKANHPNGEKLTLEVVETLPQAIDGKKHALTTGIEKASSEWILLTDADCVPASKYWIDTFMKHVSPKTSILLGVSPYRWSSGLLNALIQYETFQTALKYISSALNGNPYMGIGRNLAYRKSLFIESGGFKGYEDITGGDDDLFVQQNATAQNTKVVLAPESLTYSATKRRFKTYLRQKTRHLSVGKHYRSKLKVCETLRSVIHLSVWLSFLYLAVNGQAGEIETGIFCALWIVKGVISTFTASKIGMVFNLLWFPVADFLYAVLLPLISIRAVSVKNVKWKKTGNSQIRH